jgi:HD-like signal output (HDOD) protein/CheY-like chemotaxis protein
MTEVTKQRILFVDDEPAILSALQNLLYRDRRRWELVFAGGGEQALAELAKGRFDVVVSDMRMPGMDGATLLHRIRDSHPGTVRIVLSGQAGRDAIVKALPALHQLLSKPCDAATLRAALERGTALGQLHASDAVKAVIGRLDTLPSPPASFYEISRALEASATVADVAGIVSRDPAMSAKVLQLVNSSYFATGQVTSSIEEAVRQLGTERLRYVLLTASVFSPADHDPFPELSLDAAQQHALRCARAIDRSGFAGPRSAGADADQAFVAAILHDIGQLVLALGLPDDYRDILAAGAGSPCDAERAALGVTHAEVGACLLEIWGLPRAIVEAVRAHHDPASAPPEYRALATALHAADIADDEAG